MGSMGNINNLLKQAQKMQQDAEKVHEEITLKEFEVTAGGGAATIMIKGSREIMKITLKPEIVDPEDIETLEDILVAAFNEAVRKVDDYTAQEMGKVTKGINMPGMF